MRFGISFGADASPSYWVWAAESESTEPAASAPPAVEQPTADSAPSGATTAAPEPTVAQTPPAAAEPPKTDWRDRRLAEKTRQVQAARAAEAAARDRVAELEAKLRAAGGVPAAAGAVPTDEAAIEARIKVEAAQRVATEAFVAKCNEVAETGRKAFGEAVFDSRVRTLVEVADLSDPVRANSYTTLLTAAMETGQASKILYDLGADPEKFETLLSLPPVKMGVELAKLAASAVPTPSAAPKPVTPLGGRAGVNERIDPRDPARADRLSTAEWMARREEQLRAGAA